MRKKYIIGAMVVVVAAFVGVFSYASNTSDNVQTAELSVSGMHCSNCVNSVKSAMEGVKGVESAKVSLKTNSAVVKYSSGETNLDVIKAAVVKAGYGAKDMKAGESVKCPANGKQCSPDEMNKCTGGSKETSKEM